MGVLAEQPVAPPPPPPVVIDTSRDALTGLRSRQQIIERLSAEMQSAQRYEYELSVCLCDVDHFRSLNDMCGQEVGDIVLAQLAKLLIDELRTEDIAGRIGGDEFCIILQHTPVDGACATVGRIRNRIANTVFAAQTGARIPVSVTFGVSSMVDGMLTVEELIGMAVRDLHENKKALVAATEQ